MLHKDLNDEVDLKYFIEHTKDLDMLRKQNFALIFPVYKVVQKELAKTNRTYETEKAGYNEFLSVGTYAIKIMIAYEYVVQ